MVISLRTVSSNTLDLNIKIGFYVMNSFPIGYNHIVTMVDEHYKTILFSHRLASFNQLNL